MSKIYQALRRHEQEKYDNRAISHAPRSQLEHALEAVYPLIQRLVPGNGRGIVIQFVAASSGEGTSTLSSEFALAASRISGSKVLLVDADRMKLATAARFGCATEEGIVDFPVRDSGFDARMTVAENGDGLRVGVLSGQRSQLVLRKEMAALFDVFRDNFDLTVMDCPAVFSDRYFELSPEAADGIVLVVEAERNRPEMIRQAQSNIENAGGKVVGSILNRRHTYIPDFLYRLL